MTVTDEAVLQTTFDSKQGPHSPTNSPFPGEVNTATKAVGCCDLVPYLREMAFPVFLISIALVSVLLLNGVAAKVGYVPFDEPIKTVVISNQPHTYLSASDLPTNFDWRNVNGTNYGSKVLTQQSPSVCGSCWAEAATGALSDRYTIATQGRLRLNLAPQQLINFNARYVRLKLVSLWYLYIFICTLFPEQPVDLAMAETS